MSKFKKVNELKKHVLSPKVADALAAVLEQNNPNCDFYTVFISICNKAERAKVFNGSSKTIAGAWANAERKLEDFTARRIKIKKPYGASWAKADVVTSYEQINTVDLNKIVIRERYENFCRVGVALGEGFEGFKGSKTAFLEAELNANKTIAYYSEEEFKASAFERDANLLFLDNINNYRKKNYKLAPLEEIPEKICVFTTQGFFIGEDDTIHELYSAKPNEEKPYDFGRRRLDEVTGEAVRPIIVGASEYLASLIDEQGKFVYGYYPIFNKEIDNYNIVRHAGTVWSIINLYRISNDESLVPKINAALGFLDKCIVERDANTAYILETKTNEIKLGANGVAMLSYTEYMSVFNTDKYADTVRKLAEGILALQDSATGEYTHVLKYPSYALVEKFRTVYYDGEATFALVRAYEVTKDKRFLDGAVKAVEYFIANDYTKWRDHWVSYALFEVTKHVPRVDFYDFSLENADKNLKAIYSRAESIPTRLELFMLSWRTYKRALADKVKSDYIKNYDPTQYAQTIYYRARHMLNGYFAPEIAMYMKVPEKIVGSFMIRDDDYRVRIDDTQHFIGGYYFYSLYYSEIREFLSDDFIRSLDKSEALIS